MVQILTQAPEVQIRAQNPFNLFIGAQIPQDNAISKLGKQAANIADAVISDRQETLDSRATARFVLSMVSQGEQAAREALGTAFDVPLGNEDVQDLKDSARISNKLEMSRLQNPGRARDVLRRTATLREAIATNPRLAPEFLEIFSNTGGGTFGEQIKEVQTDANAERAAKMEFYTRESLTNGLSLSIPLDRRIEIIDERNAIKRRAEVSAQKLQILQNQGQVDRLMTLNTIRREMVPGFVMDAVGTVRDLLEPLKGGDGKVRDDLTDEDKVAIKRELDIQLGQIQNSIISSGGGLITQADVDTTMLPFSTYKDLVSKTLDGTYELDQLESDLAALEITYQSEFARNHPEVNRILSVYRNVFKGLDPDRASALALLVAGSGSMSMIADAITDETNTAVLLRDARLQNPNRTPEELNQTFDSVMNTITSEGLERDDRVKLLGSMFRIYQVNRNDPDASMMLNRILPKLSDPLVLDALKNGVTTDAQLASNIRTGVEVYLKDLAEAVSGEVGENLSFSLPGPNTDAFMVDPLQTSPIPFLFAGTQDAIDFVDLKFTEAGVPVFTPKDNAPPAIQQAIPRLNQVGTKIGQVVTLITDLGLVPQSLNKAEIAAAILSDGKLPALVPGERRDETINTQIDNNALDDIESIVNSTVF